MQVRIATQAFAKSSLRLRSTWPGSGVEERRSSACMAICRPSRSKSSLNQGDAGVEPQQICPLSATVADVPCFFAVRARWIIAISTETTAFWL